MKQFQKFKIPQQWIYNWLWHSMKHLACNFFFKCSSIWHCWPWAGSTLPCSCKVLFVGTAVKQACMSYSLFCDKCQQLSGNSLLWARTRYLSTHSWLTEKQWGSRGRALTSHHQHLVCFHKLCQCKNDEPQLHQSNRRRRRRRRSDRSQITRLKSEVKKSKWKVPRYFFKK